MRVGVVVCVSLESSGMHVRVSIWRYVRLNNRCSYTLLVTIGWKA